MIGHPRHPYLTAFLLVAAATAVGKTLLSHVAPTNQVMLYLLAVVISGLWCGRDATVITSVLGVLAFDVFFVPPVYHLTVHDAEYIITFIAFLVVALVIGSLTSRLREHAAALQTREAETSALYAFSRRMAAARDLDEVVQATVEHVQGTCGREASLHLAGDATDGASQGRPGLRIPLRTPRGEVGALTVAGGESLDPSQRRLLEALAAQAAIALERANLEEAARRAELLMEAEKLHDALLHSISHSLRTPLASIIGCLSTLMDPGQARLDPATRLDLVQTAREEAERLNGLVGNLLAMTRLEAGYLKLLIDWYDLADVIGAALGRAERSLRGHPVTVDLPDDLPLVPLDQALMVQVLENLLDNAAKYSPPGAPIEIRIRQADGVVQVSVADRGWGIPGHERERVFEKFYRVERPGSPLGTGLGLAICKGIIEAHHGRIWAEARAGGGTVVAFTLPAPRPRPAAGGDARAEGAGGG